MKKIYVLFALLVLSCTVLEAQPVNGTTTFFTNTTTLIHSLTPCSPGKQTTLSGWLFTVQSTSNCGMNWTNTSGGDGRFQYMLGFGTLTQASFGSDDGSEFALNNLLWGVNTTSWTSKTMVFVGYKNGLPVPGATVTAVTPAGTGVLNTQIVTFTNTPAFKDVDNITLETAPGFTCNSNLFLEEITVSTATPACIPSTLTLAGTKSVSCNGGSTGSATVSASVGAPFTYTWSPSGGNSFTATGLSTGVYTVVTTNSCGVTASQTVSILQPPALVTSTAVTNVACNGGSNGVGAITASGGAGGYSYLWSNGAITSAITGLTAGVRTATVTDANNCTSIKSVNITQPSALVTTTAVTNVACNGGSNGSATITASGGAGGYSYLWSNGGSTSAITGLLAGVYTATVTDANSCTSIKSTNVTQPTALVTTTAVTNVACNGGSNGVASITASGGAGSYTYLWSNGGSTSAITGLLAGVYTATVTDANSCTSIKSVNITQPTAIVTTTAVTNVACNGGSNGVASITASGGAGSYTYLWSNGGSPSAITGLLAGVYTATVTDANSCTSIQSAFITEPLALVTSTAATNVACNGGTGGSATITASGGTGGYTYLWSTGATASLVAGINAGVYTATVTDNNGCTNTKSVTINQPSALVTTTAVTNVSCNGAANGSATVTASGGTGLYTYFWTGGTTFSVLTNAVAGVYTITVIDANSCTGISQVNITQPAALNTTITASSASTCAGGQVSLTASASGGTGAISYSWTSGPNASVNVVSPVLTATYTVTATDANLCVNTQTYSINVAPLPLISVSDYSLCSGTSVTIIPTGANTYTISGGSFTVSPLSNTSYSITGTSLAGCVSATFTVSSVTVAPSPTLAIANASICSGQTYTFAPTGNAVTYSVNGSSSLTVSPLTTTSYTINGTGGNGCSLVNGVVATMSVDPTPTLSLNSATICSGETVTLVPSGAAGGTYTISGGSFTISPVATTDYTLTGSSAYLCPAGNTVVITVSVNITPTLSINSATICSGETVTLIPSGAAGGTYTISGGTYTVAPLADTNYTLTGTGDGNCPASNTVVAAVVVNSLPVVTVTDGEICIGQTFSIQATGADTYSVNAVANATVVSPLVTTSYSVTGTSLQGCVSGSVAVLTVSVNPLPVISATASESLICLGSGIDVILTGGNATTYTWSTGDNTATVSVNPAETTTYVLQGSSDKGCVSSATVEITVDACTGVHSPSAEIISLISVFPNPGNGEFVIQAAEPAEIFILDATGRLIMSQLITPGNTPLLMKEAANGIYFIRATAGSKQQNITLIKQ